MGKNSRYYIDSVRLLEELKLSKAQGRPTDKLFEMFMLLSVRISYKMRYRDPMDREDCQSGALMDLIKYWGSINMEMVEGKPMMAFAYLSQIAKTGSAKAFNALYPNNRHGVQVLHMGEIFRDDINI